MKKKVCIDAGHYKDYNQSNIFKSYKEGNMTWIWQKYIKEALEQYEIEVIITRSNTSQDVKLYDRGAMSKGCDLFISGHSNACDDASINRVVIIPGLNSDKAFADALGACVSSVMGITSKYQIYTRTNSSGGEYYGVLRGANVVGTKNRYIIEHSFHTNYNSAKWLYDENNIKKVAYAEAEAIAKHLGVCKTSINKGYYRVVAGSYKSKETAEKEIERLKKLGVNSFLLYVE